MTNKKRSEQINKKSSSTPDNGAKDIVFVTPPLSHQERYGVKFKVGGQTPPTGLALLAAVCRENGYKVSIIDAAVLEMDYIECVKNILKKNPKYVGITAVTLSIFNAKKTCMLLKKRYPNLKIIIGGPHITAVPEETVKRMGRFFDIAVIGEGELTIIDLLHALENKKPLSKVKGIAYFSKKDNNKLLFTKKREYLTDMDSLPFPAWDLLPNLAKHYLPPGHTVKKFPATILITSRGCPGMCTFCDNRVFGRALRSYSVDYIIKMMKHLIKTYGIKEFQIRDDNFLMFRKRVIELCKRMIEEKLNVVWTCAGRIDMVTPEILRLMKKAGCWQIWYGIESGSDRILKIIKKNTNQEMIRKAVLETKKAGISPCGFFILGLPSETEEDVKKTIDVILKLPIDEFHMGHLTPLPGSEIYTSASQYGYFDNDWIKMSGWEITFIPKNLSEKKMHYYSHHALKKFYFRPRIILNYIKRIRSIHHVKIYANGLFAILSYIGRKNKK